MTTDIASKAPQVMQDVFTNLGGTGDASNVDEFRRIVGQASLQQVDRAWREEAWENLLQPYIKNGGDPLPTTATEQVGILFEAVHTRLSEKSGSSTRS